MTKFDFIGKRRRGPERPRVYGEEKRPKGKVTLRDWILTMVIALLVALFIRGFLIEAYRIPTSSMERTLMAGDFVLVSKLHYGPRLPRTIGIPFTNLHVPRVVFPSLRIPGFSRPTRGDIIVFNFPVDDKPVSQKTHYIKRIIGLPGDSLRIIDKMPIVNGRPFPLGSEMQQRWLAVRKLNARFPIERLQENGIIEVGTVGPRVDGVSFESTVAFAHEVASWSEVEKIEPLVTPNTPGVPTLIFPEGSGFGKDNYGPLYIPRRGDRVRLTDENVVIYRNLITSYEGHDFEETESGAYLIDGQPATHYVIEQNYYFVMGDNRDSSYDSRLWGFVPWDHVVGKATTIYFSWDLNQGQPRYDRMFTKVF